MISKLLSLEPIWLLILAPLVLLPELWQPDLHRWAIGGLFLFWPLRLITEGRVMVKTPLNMAGAILLCCLPVGIMIAVEPALAWQSAGYLLFGIALAVAIIQWPLLRPEWLVYSLIAMGLAFSILSLALYSSSFVFLHKIFSFTNRLDNMINANVLAGTLVLVIPFLLSIAISPAMISNLHKRWAIRGCTVSIMLLLGMGLWVTESRGGYLAALAACAIVTGLYWPRLGRVISLTLLSCLACLLLMWFVNFPLPSGYGLAVGWQDRMAIWERVGLALEDFPFTGIGIGQFGVVIPEFYPYFHHLNGAIPHAHNLWLQISMDLGIPGLVAYLALQMNLCLMLCRAYNHFGPSYRPSSAYWTLTIGSWGALSALIVHGLLDAVTWGTKVSFVPWLVMAVVVLLFEKTV